MAELERRIKALIIKDPSYKESRSGNWRMFRYLEAEENMEFYINGIKVDAKWLSENLFPIDNIRRVCQKLRELNPEAYGPSTKRPNIAAQRRQEETLQYVRST